MLSEMPLRRRFNLRKQGIKVHICTVDCRNKDNYNRCRSLNQNPEKCKKFILHTHGDAKIKLEVVFVAKILIVEDNVDTNEALSEYLQEAGHEIISTYDGTEALEILSQNKIDLIVLDIMLPTMSGLAVLNAVRKTSQIPVIMLTALEDEYTQVSSFDCLADDYMTKPFSMVVLGKRITALLLSLIHI